MIARVRLLVLAACIVLLGAACEVGLEVQIEVADDGSGVVSVGVSLDEEAVGQVRDFEETLVVDDIESAGWVVTGPEVEGDGLTWIRASKPFRSTEELTPIMEEIAGPDGAFRDFVLLREKGFAQLDFTLTGTVDLTSGPTSFSDEAVEQVLGDSDVAARIAELEEEFGPVADNVTVTVRVSLPGGAEGEAIPGEGAVWEVSFDDPAPTQVAASASDENLSAKLWRLVGLAALALFGIAAIVQLVSWLLERRARKRAPASGLPAATAPGIPLSARSQMPPQPVPPQQLPPQAIPPQPVQQQPVGAQPVAPAPEPAQPQRKLQLVVLDPTTVVFDLADDPRIRLIPYLRARGSEVADQTIVEAYREASLGRLTTAELWETSGVDGDPAGLDADYVSSVAMRPGAPEFLAEMARRAMSVAFLGNTAMEWARLLRQREGVASVGTWVISAAVGVRNPDPGILEALRSATGVPLESCLMVDGRVMNLDNAKMSGMATALYAPEGQPAEESGGHSVVTGFAEFFRRR